MTALYLNSYPLTLTGKASLFQMRGAAASRTRGDLRQLTGVPVFVEDEHAYAYREPAGVEWEPINEQLARRMRFAFGWCAKRWSSIATV